MDSLFRKYIVPNISSRKIQVKPKRRPISRNYIFHVFLALISLLNILIAKQRKITRAHYLIDIDNSSNYYDFRSKEFLKIIPPKKTLNFMHINSTRFTLFTFFKKVNVVYFESIYYTVKPFLKLKKFNSKKKHHGFSKELLDIYGALYSDSYYIHKISKFILNFLHIKQFIFIDDSRYSNELKIASKENGIETIGYMHGRFNKYHLGIFEFPFDKYLVWSPYFIDLLLKNKSKYQTENLFITGNPRILKKKQMVSRNRKNLLLLGESNINIFDLNNYLEFILSKGYKVFFRGKPGDIDKSLYENLIETNQNEDFFDCLHTNNISLVLGTHSTALMESWIVGVPSLALRCSYDYGRHLWEDGLIKECSDLKSLEKNLEITANLPKRKVKEILNLIWGGKEVFDHRKVKEILFDGPNLN